MTKNAVKRRRYAFFQSRPSTEFKGFAKRFRCKARNKANREAYLNIR